MDEINTYLDSSQRVVYGSYLKSVQSSPYASVLVLCRAAFRPSLFVCGLHTNGTSCMSTLLWSGPFASTGQRLLSPPCNPHTSRTLSCTVHVVVAVRSSTLSFPVWVSCMVRIYICYAPFAVHHIVSAKCAINIDVLNIASPYLSHSRKLAAGTRRHAAAGRTSSLIAACGTSLLYLFLSEYRLIYSD